MRFIWKADPVGFDTQACLSKFGKHCMAFDESMNIDLHGEN
jgi:hypothetical protein